MSFINTSAKPYPRIGLIVACLLIMAGGAALWGWHNMPIYPDEIAMMLSRGRAIQDNGIAYGLYSAVCESTVRETPSLFILPAWFLSYVGLVFSPEALRILPIATVLASFGISLACAVRKDHPITALWALAALVGVAGSGLVLARHEFVAEINLLVCFLAILMLDGSPISRLARTALVVLLAASSLFSAYVHIQGLLFLPLTALLMYRILQYDAKPWIALLLSLGFLAILATATISFQSASCPTAPEIDSFIRSMTYGGDNGWKTALLNLGEGYQEHVRRFLYRDAYNIAYLPPVLPASVMQKLKVGGLNGVVILVVSINALITMLVAAQGIYAFIKSLIQSQESVGGRLNSAIARPEVALAGAAIPVLFLFACDTGHNFYRVFFLNYAATILAVFYLSSRPQTRFRGWLIALVVIAVIASTYANSRFFSPKFGAGGYEGPSISTSRYGEQLAQNIETLKTSCNIDGQPGMIVDDLTYSELKQTRLVYPITYLHLQSKLLQVPMTQVVSRTHARVAVARCGLFEDSGLPFSHRAGDICCVDLLPSNESP